MNFKSAIAPVIVAIMVSGGLFFASTCLAKYVEAKKAEIENSIVISALEPLKQVSFDFKRMFPSSKAEFFPGEQFVYFSKKLYPTYSVEKKYIEDSGVTIFGFSECFFSVDTKFLQCNSHTDCRFYIVKDDSEFIHYQSHLLAPLLVTDFFIESMYFDRFSGNIYNAYMADHENSLNPELWSYSGYNFFLDKNNSKNSSRFRVTAKPPREKDKIAWMEFKEKIPNNFYARFTLEAKYKDKKKLQPMIRIENMIMTIGEKKDREIRVYDGESLVEKKDLTDFSNNNHTIVELYKKGNTISILVNGKPSLARSIFKDNEWSNIAIGIRGDANVFEIQSITLRQTVSI